jgi:hypothetical protein
MVDFTMSIYTVDEDGQIFISPPELDNFEYYRDNVFVRTYEEFLFFNPHEFNILWTDRTGPDYWESLDTDYIEWDGSAWEVKQDPPGFPILKAIGNWANSYRPGWLKLEGDSEYIEGQNAELRGEVLSVSSYTIAEYVNVNGAIAPCNFSQDDDIYEFKLTDYNGSFPLHINTIKFSESDDVFGIPVSATYTHTIGYTFQYSSGIDIDSNGALHIAGYAFSYSGTYYGTNATGSWVYESLGGTYYECTLVLINDIPHILGKGSSNQLYHLYKDGTWQADLIDSTGPANYMTQHCGLDSSNTLWYFYGQGVPRLYKRNTSDVWTLDLPSGMPSTSITAYGLTVDSDNHVYIIFETTVTGTTYFYELRRHASNGWDTYPGTLIASRTSGYNYGGVYDHDGSGNFYFQHSEANYDMKIYRRLSGGSWSLIHTIDPGLEYHYDSESRSSQGMIDSNGVFKVFWAGDNHTVNHLRVLSITGAGYTDEMIKIDTDNYMKCPEINRGKMIIMCREDNGSGIWILE